MQTFDSDKTTTISRPLYEERDMLMSERFYPGEFGWVIVLAVASLLVYSIAVWGLVSEQPKPPSMGFTSYSGYTPVLGFPEMTDPDLSTPLAPNSTTPMPSSPIEPNSTTPIPSSPIEPNSTTPLPSLPSAPTSPGSAY